MALGRCNKPYPVDESCSEVELSEVLAASRGPEILYFFPVLSYLRQLHFRTDPEPDRRPPVTRRVVSGSSG